MASFYKVDLQERNWLDQVFVGRNKDYGAYQLRSRYSNTVIISVIIGIALFSFALAFPVIVNALKGILPEDKQIAEVNTLQAPPPVDETKPPPPPPPKNTPPPQKPQIKFTPPVIKKDVEVKKEDVPPPVEETKHTDIGATTVKGDPNANINIPDDPNAGKGAEVGEDPNKVFVSVEQNPQYPGGDEALLRDLNKYAVYPPEAKENNIQGTVNIQFVVEKDGSISGIRIMRGKELGAGIPESAMNAVRKLKRFTPGRQNGNSVRVYFSVPVTFRLEGAE